MSLFTRAAVQGRVVSEGSWYRTRRTELSLRVLLSAAATLAGSCALVIDTERQQCSEASDCVKELGGTVTYTCEQNLCREQPECTTNEQCLSSGKNICLVDRCVACVVDTDCKSATGTATCVANVCEDPRWGCLSERDNRPMPTEGTSSVTAYVPNVLTMMPVPGITVHRCLESTIDPECMQTVTGSVGSYDDATGMATVTGIPHGMLYRLQLRPPEGSSLSIREFYTNRPPKGVETIPPDLGLVPLSVLTNLPSPFPIDITRPALSIRIYDCQGTPAEGVSVAMVDPPADLATAYLTETQMLRFDEKVTSKRGYVGMLNAKARTLTTLSVKYGPTELFTYRFAALGDRTVTIDLYPRIF